jgi:hypothetical protein
LFPDLVFRSARAEVLLAEEFELGCEIVGAVMEDSAGAAAPGRDERRGLGIVERRGSNFQQGELLYSVAVVVHRSERTDCTQGTLRRRGVGLWAKVRSVEVKAGGRVVSCGVEVEAREIVASVAWSGIRGI